jgi:ABC-type lipoprotein export system ATPase subunit
MTVVISRLTKRFRRGSETVTALDDVSLVLHPGELTVAAGPSGSGKTTLLSIVAGFEVPDAGAVRFESPSSGGGSGLLSGGSWAASGGTGAAPGGSGPPARGSAEGGSWPAPGAAPASLTWRHLAFVPQGLALLDELTVRENVEIPFLLDPSADTGVEADELLEQLEIRHLADRYPAQTSGGEQQRTAVARALRLRPPMLLGDEPTGHQDRGRIDLVISILRAHAYAGNVVLISSHDEAVISAGDRVVTLADGRIASDARASSALRPRH